jgi:WhiB family redox-sensing transcriptional regulator
VAVRWKSLGEADVDDWRALAACRSVDANLFFPSGSTGPAVVELQRAKAFCRSCPVQRACLEFALETNQEDGVWGGKDETERRQLRLEWRQSRTQVGRRAGGLGDRADGLASLDSIPSHARGAQRGPLGLQKGKR